MAKSNLNLNMGRSRSKTGVNHNKGQVSLYTNLYTDLSDLPSQPNPNVIKLMVVGDDAAGKTCFVLQWAEGGFNNTHIPTLGVDFKDRLVKVHRKEFLVELWDTAGSERFDDVTSQFYNNMEGYLIMFDLTDYNSFKNVEKWMSKVKDQAKNPPIVLVGNKSDLDDRRLIKGARVKAFAKQMGVHYYESSGKFNSQIDEPMEDLCAQALARRKELTVLRKKFQKEERMGSHSRLKSNSTIESRKSGKSGKSRSLAQIFGRKDSRTASARTRGRIRSMTRRDSRSETTSVSRRFRGRSGKRRCAIL